ncbi:MAG: U32 family peptidase [Peptostreptococcaceae bacterium]|nr:U32 family peptidase [Peptostreptococcaceae bacterium]
MDRVELLAPAGDLEKLKFAFIYGADAVYIGGQTFGLRASAKNFSFEEMKEGIEFAHERGKRVYVTLNIIPHNEDLNDLQGYLSALEKMKADAVIVSDPGTIAYIREHNPGMEIHLSTQANTTNYLTAGFWHSQGLPRVVLARELSFNEIKETIDKSPSSLGFEMFVHGAMCISYSGRCLLSNYLANRDANRGECAHPCRWKYQLMEEKRPGEYFPVVEDENGTYFFNSKDLCLIGDLKEIIESGVRSLKIEGRMKSLYYVANTVRAYRAAIDSYYEDPYRYTFDEKWIEELNKSSHRKYERGFFSGRPDGNAQIYDTASYERSYDFIGVVKDYNFGNGIAKIEQRNKFVIGDEIEIMSPGFQSFKQTVTELYDENMNPVMDAPHPKGEFYMSTSQPVKAFDILRKLRKEG